MAAGEVEPGYCLAGAQTALQMLQQQHGRPSISLGAAALDALLQVRARGAGLRWARRRLQLRRPRRLPALTALTPAPPPAPAAPSGWPRRVACSWAA